MVVGSTQFFPFCVTDELGCKIQCREVFSMRSPRNVFFIKIIFFVAVADKCRLMRPQLRSRCRYKDSKTL